MRDYINTYNEILSGCDSNIESNYGLRNVSFSEKVLMGRYFSLKSYEEMNNILSRLDKFDISDTNFHQYRLAFDRMSQSTENCQYDFEVTEDWLSEQTEFFLMLLKNTKFKSGYDNDVTLYFSELYTKAPVDVLSWLLKLFLRLVKSEEYDSIVKILKVLLDYSYEEVTTTGEYIASVALLMESLEIQSEALSLFGAWCNRDAYELLKQYRAPSDVFLKVKYKKVLNLIRERCNIYE